MSSAFLSLTLSAFAYDPAPTSFSFVNSSENWTVGARADMSRICTCLYYLDPQTPVLVPNFEFVYPEESAEEFDTCEKCAQFPMNIDGQTVSFEYCHTPTN